MTEGSPRFEESQAPRQGIVPYRKKRDAAQVQIPWKSGVRPLKPAQRPRFIKSSRILSKDQLLRASPTKSRLQLNQLKYGSFCSNQSSKLSATTSYEHQRPHNKKSDGTVGKISFLI